MSHSDPHGQPPIESVDPDTPTLPDGLPDEVYKFGRPLAVFRGVRFGPVQRVLETGVIVGLVLLAAYGGFLQYERYLREDGFYVHGIQVGQLLLVAFPLLLVLEGSRNRTLLGVHTALLYPDRLVCVGKQGGGPTYLTFRWGQLLERPGAVVEVRWAKVESVRQETSIQPGWFRPKVHHRFAIRTHRGREIVLQGDFSLPENDLAVLGDRIQRAVTKELLPAAERHFHAGETLKFGKLIAHRSGLTVDDKQLPWKAVDKVVVEGGEVRLLAKGTPAAVARMGEVDNLYVFLGLVKDAAGIPVEVTSLTLPARRRQAMRVPPGSITEHLLPPPARRGRAAAFPALAVMLLLLGGLYFVFFGPVSKSFYTARGAELSVDGRRIYESCDDGAVRVLDIDTQQVLATLQGHGAAVLCTAVSPDGRHLASGSEDERIRIWDLASGKPIRTLLGHAGAVRALAYSPDGQRLFSGSEDKRVFVWNAATGEHLQSLEGSAGRITCVAVHPDGHRVAAARLLYRNETTEAAPAAVVWDTDTGKIVQTLAGAENSVCYTPDGKRLLTGGKEAKIWDAETGKQVGTLPGHPDPVTQICVSQDGKRLASMSRRPGKGTRSTLKTWDAAGPTPIGSWEKPAAFQNWIAFTPDGRAVVAFNYSSGVVKFESGK